MQVTKRLVGDYIIRKLHRLMLEFNVDRHQRDPVSYPVTIWQPVQRATKTRVWRHVWSGTDHAHQRIPNPLKSAQLEIGDAVEDEVAIVQPRTHDGAGNGVGEFLVDETTDVAMCTQMIVVCAHNTGNVIVERHTATS